LIGIRRFFLIQSFRQFHFRKAVMTHQHYRYNWAGDYLQNNPKISGKRWIERPSRMDGSPSGCLPAAFDIRSWITPGGHWEIQKVLRKLRSEGMPTGTSPGSYDLRALRCWEFVSGHVTYVADPPLTAAGAATDIWQFPAETLALGSGSCEDCSFLLATLMIASAISEENIRVVIGQLERRGLPTETHAWVIYRDEGHSWRILESTSRARRIREAPEADDASLASTDPRYIPVLCFNSQHVWSIAPEFPG